MRDELAGAYTRVCDGTFYRAVVSMGFCPSYWKMPAGPVIAFLSGSVTGVRCISFFRVVPLVCIGPIAVRFPPGRWCRLSH